MRGIKQNFVIWLLTSCWALRDLQETREEIVKAISLLIQSENRLRTDLVTFTNAVNINTAASQENTREIKELNKYFEEIKISRDAKNEQEVEEDAKADEGAAGKETKNEY